MLASGGCGSAGAQGALHTIPRLDGSRSENSLDTRGKRWDDLLVAELLSPTGEDVRADVLARQHPDELLEQPAAGQLVSQSVSHTSCVCKSM